MKLKAFFIFEISALSLAVRYGQRYNHELSFLKLIAMNFAILLVCIRWTMRSWIFFFVSLLHFTKFINGDRHMQSLPAKRYRINNNVISDRAEEKKKRFIKQEKIHSNERLSVFSINGIASRWAVWYLNK